MGTITKIAWCDHTLNPIIGCEKVSPGCKHCYAEVSTPVRVSRSRGLELWGPGSARRETQRWEAEACAWNRAAELAGKRASVFCASLSDVFEDHPTWRTVRARLYTLVCRTPWLDWLLLTKRPENAARLWVQAKFDAAMALRAQLPTWQSNVVLGTTVEDQAAADARIPHLLEAGAARTFLSCEPLLEAVTFEGERLEWLAPFKDTDAMLARTPRVDWVIVGGESGKHARPFNLRWARALILDSQLAHVPVFVKQLGAKPVIDQYSVPLVLADDHGADMDEWPGDLRIREPLPELVR